MMMGIMILGTSMAVLSACFWCAEAWPFVKAVKAIKPVKESKNPITVITESLRFIVDVIGAVTKVWPLVVDITVTIWLVGALGFTGMVGAAMGLTVSNVISIFLIWVSRKPKES